MTEFEQNITDDQLQDPDYLAASAGTGFENAILEQNELSDIDDLGDVSGGVSLVVEDVDANLRVDLVAFRRGELLVMVFSFYPDGASPLVDARDVARTIDQRLMGMPADL